MEQERFDDLARRLAGADRRGLSRRAVVTGAAAGLLAALGVRRHGDAKVTQAQCGNTSCKNNPVKCAPGCVCCAHGNGNTRCTTPGSCSGTITCPAGQRYCPGLGRCAACCANTDCDDGNACTQSVCVDGVCANPPIVCNDNNACTTDTCNPATGCVFTPLVCDDGNACTTDSCNPDTGCVYTTVVCAGPCEECSDGACRSTCVDGEICVDDGCCPACGGDIHGPAVCCDAGEACVAGGYSSICCPAGQAACGGDLLGPAVCCDADEACVAAGFRSICCPAGHAGCASGFEPFCCGAGEVCITEGLIGVCCPEGGSVCGILGGPAVCCGAGEVCIAPSPFERGCCPADRTCPNGAGGHTCCPAGQVCCGGVCTDIMSDAANCGACGNGCTTSSPCSSATCLGGTCAFSTIVNCCTSDSQCGDINPCTVSTCDLATHTCRHDPVANNTACGGGRVCCEGACVDDCCPGGQVSCGGTCTNTMSDAANCGACGHACVAGRECSCPPGQICFGLCCETGTCSNGVCGTNFLMCPSCATPVCNPTEGAICVSNCPPPPDACRTGPGTCTFGGCTYEPTCGPGQTCDPSTGTCSNVCRSCETYDPGSGQCVSACTTPPGPCRTVPGTCNDDGSCSYTMRDCGPCSLCDPGTSQCYLAKAVGSSCGTCMVCTEQGTCQFGAVGSSCGTCMVCNEHGTCQFGGDGTGCGTCRVCSGGACGFAAPGTSCGDGQVCDGVGNCGCALQCGSTCCPSGSVSCCVNGGLSECCSEECVFLPPVGFFCPTG